MGGLNKIGWLFIFILIGYLIFVGIRVAKIYINDYHLREIIKKETIVFFSSDTDLIRRIVKRARNSNIPIEKNEIYLIKKEDEYAFFRVSYSRVLDALLFKHKINFDYEIKARLY